MLVEIIGGYLITFEHLEAFCARRHLDITGDISDQVYNLRKYLRGRSIPFPVPTIVNYPRPTPVLKEKSKLFVLMVTRERYEGEQSPLLDDFAPFEENDEDKNIKAWLEHNGIKDVPFVTIVDPGLTIGEYIEPTPND
ncbi:hypothetical protein BV22DRAFT_737217 [Leucogyrophana mollusca]|uniref:Uncharacterized protein n=1 Tax=Leucogyrophana mollusca TaxID=85980 RepID=A0ACB8B8V0_9AGAM|nr:hypothetical protein BV22DRAFT_737217 [Leucogyrophana mollusca]